MNLHSTPPPVPTRPVSVLEYVPRVPRNLAAVGAVTLAFVVLADWLFFAQPRGWAVGA